MSGGLRTYRCTSDRHRERSEAVQRSRRSHASPRLRRPRISPSPAAFCIGAGSLRFARDDGAGAADDRAHGDLDDGIRSLSYQMV